MLSKLADYIRVNSQCKCDIFPLQTSPGPGHEGDGFRTLWKKLPKSPQDESRCLHPDGAAAGLLQVRRWLVLVPGFLTVAQRLD